MSGQKRVTIDETEWIRLKKQAGQLKKLQRDLPSMIESVRRQTRADLERVSEELENRQAAVEESMKNLSEQARQLHEDTNRRLRDQARRFQTRLEETAGKLREESDAALAEHRDEVRTELAELRRKSQDDMRQLKAQLGGLVAQDRRAAETARSWIADARTLHAVIRDVLPHERHAPRRLAALESRLVTAEQNVAEGHPESAIAAAQEAFHGLSELRVEVELAEQERVATGIAAGEALDYVRALAEENAMRPVLDDDGVELSGVILDVDHWTTGRLGGLRAEIQKSLQSVRDPAEPMSTDEFLDVSRRVAPAYESRLGELVEQAGVRQLASQLRVNVADVVVSSLHDIAGYELVDSTYDGDDEREAFAAKLKSINGNEIVVDVAPSPDDSGRFVLRVLSYDHDTTAETELRNRARVIHADLRQQGVNAQPPEAERGAPDPALRDFAARRALPAAAPRPAPGAS